MSTTERFEESVAYAADCLVEHHGLDGAIAELIERRERRDGEAGRVNEALAYVRRRYNGEDR